MLRHKEGQKVKVIDKKNGHKFKIGEIVEITGVDSSANDGKGDYKCSNGINYWYLTDDEVE